MFFLFFFLNSEILLEKPVVMDSVSVTDLRLLPEGTFGRAYAAFMDVHGLNFFLFSSDFFLHSER
jgi:ubiquinone biosynthesis protein Coq4